MGEPPGPRSRERICSKNGVVATNAHLLNSVAALLSIFGDGLTGRGICEENIGAE